MTIPDKPNSKNQKYRKNKVYYVKNKAENNKTYSLLYNFMYPYPHRKLL